MKFWLLPSFLVVAIGSVKYTSFAFVPDPSIGFFFIALFSLHQHLNVRIDLAMNIRFIPSLKFTDSLKDRVFCIKYLCSKSTRTMCTELSTDSLHIPVRISKAERAAVQWNQGLSALNKRLKRCFL